MIKNSQEKEVREAERRNVTVVFADVTGFTELSEKMDPEELRNLMNKFFQMIGTVVNKYEGTIDKFIGDAVMVLFGALISHENDPERAIRSALEMQETLENFNKENEIPLSVSIGINTGTAALNTLNYYSDFTVINVIKWKNVASLRLKQIKVFHDYEKYDYYDEKFILGIVNSRLESFYFNKTMRSGLHTLPNNVKNLLLPIIAEIDQKSITDLVDRILAITNPPSSPFNKGGQEGDYLTNPTKQTKVKEYECQIDQMVYKLYDLTEEEIKIVECEIYDKK